jgi:predicted metal-binding membrane protein
MTGRASDYTFFGTTALLFIGSAVVTIRQSLTMAETPNMPICGQAWFGEVGAFIWMWVVMMMAMMMPSLVPALWRYRQAMEKPGNTRLGWLTVLTGLGYFIVWTAIGGVVYLLKIAMAAAEVRFPELINAVPFAVAFVMLSVGALQFSAWKARHLACCRAPVCHLRLASDSVTAWRYGIRLGMHCANCCVGSTALLLVVGIMDLRAMALVTTAITAERFAPTAAPIAHTLGAMAIGAGLFMIAQALVAALA